MADADLLQFHAFCLTDTGTRLHQYERALAATVRPGDVVLDLGTGAGLLALLACRAGASLVHAVESSDATQLAELLVGASGVADRIRIVRLRSSRLTLADRVDVVVADIHDTFGLEAGGLATLFDARDRLLKPGGILVPRAVRLVVAPAEAPRLYARDIDVWRTRVAGVDLSPLRPLSVNHVHATRFEPGDLLAPPIELTSVDLRSATGRLLAGEVQATIARAGTLHGVCGAFVTTLADDVTLSNVPGDSGTSNFAQALFPIEEPVRVSTGDRVGMALDTLDGEVARWRIEVRGVDGTPRARFEHSTLQTMPLSPATLRRRDQDYRPGLTGLGAVERALLDRIDGRTPAAELEAWLAAHFSDLLPSRREAAAFLRTAIDRWG